MKMEKKKIPFTMVANSVLVNPTLSLKAKGLYAYLFSKPDSWQFSSKRMMLECLETQPTILGIIKELEAQCLLQRKRQHNGRVDYFLKHSVCSVETTETPTQEPLVSPNTKKARQKKSPVGNSLAVSNTENISNTDKESKIEKNTPGAIAIKFFKGEADVCVPLAQDLLQKGYDKQMILAELLKFRNYWTEPTRSGRKTRWELQPTFDVRRRLGTWFRNIAERSGTRRAGAGVTV